MPEKGIKTVFLDRDGTMNVEVNYLHRPEDLRLIPGVPQAVRQLNEAGFCVVVVTNQPGWPEATTGGGRKALSPVPE